jgi:hypothetical protein
MPIPPTRRVGHISQAGITTANVGRHEGVSWQALPTGMNHEPLATSKRSVSGALSHGLNLLNLNQRRRRLSETILKRCHRGYRADQFDSHSVGVILTPAAQPQPVGPPPEKGPKANPLHNAPDS